MNSLVHSNFHLFYSLFSIKESNTGNEKDMSASYEGLSEATMLKVLIVI